MNSYKDFRTHFIISLDVDSYTHVVAWAQRIAAKPATVRGRKVNRPFGEPIDQLYNRHCRADFTKLKNYVELSKALTASLDTNSDGKIDYAEFSAAGGTRDEFAALDKDNSGTITIDELNAAAKNSTQ